MTKRIVMLASVVSVVCFGAIAWSATSEVGGGSGRVEKQRFQWRVGPFSTSSQDFTTLKDPNVFGDEALTLKSYGPVSLTFSGDFSGAPVQIRAMQDGGEMEPGAATFDPSGGTSSHSFTFVGNSQAPGCHRFTIEWRSTTGAEAVFNHGDFVVLYNERLKDESGRPFGCV